MARLTLSNDRDILDLEYVAKYGRGIQSLKGATGFGLPPVQLRFLEGAGDGAIYRGRRVLPRDVDLPLLILGNDRQDFLALWSRLAAMFADKCRLRLIEDDGETWFLDVYRVGGGDYGYGTDLIDERELQVIVTLRAPDPYWTAEVPMTQKVGG